MSSSPRTLVRSALLALAAACLVSPTPAVELAYAFPAGQPFAYRLKNIADPPQGGDVVTTLDYTFTPQGQGPFHLDGTITGTSTHVTVGNSTLAFDLSPEGAASNLTSPQLEHPTDGAFVKNGPGLFPRLPGGNLSVGTRWTAQSALHVPKMDVPGSFTTLRTVTTYTYKGLVAREDEEAGQAHLIESTTTEAPGERAKLELSTRTLFDDCKGRPISSKATGKIKVKVSLIWITVPTSYEMTEIQPGTAEDAAPSD